MCFEKTLKISKNSQFHHSMNIEFDVIDPPPSIFFPLNPNGNH